MEASCSSTLVIFLKESVSDDNEKCRKIKPSMVGSTSFICTSFPNTSSRRDSLGVPGEHGCLPDIVESQVQHHNTFESDAPAGMRGSSISGTQIVINEIYLHRHRRGPKPEMIIESKLT